MRKLPRNDLNPMRALILLGQKVQMTPATASYLPYSSQKSTERQMGNLSFWKLAKMLLDKCRHVWITRDHQHFSSVIAKRLRTCRQFAVNFWNILKRIILKVSLGSFDWYQDISIQYFSDRFCFHEESVLVKSWDSVIIYLTVYE